MRNRIIRVLGLLAAIGLVAPLIAQQGRRDRGGFGGRSLEGVTLLTQKSVQEDLKMTDDQIDKAKKVGEDLRAKMTEEFKAAGEDKEKRQEMFKKMAEKMSEASKKAVADILKPEQIKRLKQIETQVAGLNAFTKEDVQKQLKLTEKQISDVKGLIEDLGKDSSEIRKEAGREKREEAQTKIAKLRKEMTGKFVDQLSSDQKKEYKEMTGDEFKGKIEMRGFGGRPGGGQFKKKGDDSK